MQCSQITNTVLLPLTEQIGCKPQVTAPRKSFERVFDEQKQRVDRNQDSQFKKTEATKTDEIKETQRDLKEIRKENKTDEIDMKKDKKVKEKKKDEGNQDSQDVKEKDKEIKRKLMEIAKLFGIEPGKIAQLMESKDFRNAESTDGKINMLVDKVSTLLGDKAGNEEKILGDLKEVIRDLYGAGEPSKDEGVAAGQPGIETEESINTQQAKPSEISNVKTQTGKETQDVKGEGNKSEKGLEITSAAKVKNDEKSARKVEDNSKTAEEMSPKANAEVEQKDESRNEDSKSKDDKNDNGWTEKIKVMYKHNEKTDNYFKIPLQATAQGIETIQEIAAEEKIRYNLSNIVKTHDNEVLKQIIDKASVTLTSDKSEMIMNLKPDNLGKLEMKLVVEKGIITAHIVAENQQVKQIIESNFNILRDALDKQGMSIQQFSVSVGNQNSERESGNTRWKNSSNGSSKNNRVSGIQAAGYSYLNNENPINKVLWPDSTVNFTA